MLTISLLFIVTTAVSGPSLREVRSIDQKVRSVLRSLDKAMEKKDSVECAKFLSATFAGISVTGNRVNRKEAVADAQALFSRSGSIRIVRTFTGFKMVDGMATVSSRSVMKVWLSRTPFGVPDLMLDSQAVHELIREGSIWRIVSARSLRKLTKVSESWVRAVRDG